MTFMIIREAEYLFCLKCLRTGSKLTTVHELQIHTLHSAFVLFFFSNTQTRYLLVSRYVMLLCFSYCVYGSLPHNKKQLPN
jgi:hypothetical protein